MGAHDYTTIHFTYTDTTNGIYRLQWSMRGKHDPDF